MWLQWADRCPPWLPAHTTQWDQVSHLFIKPFICSAVTRKQLEVVPPRRDPKAPCGLLYLHSPSTQKSLLWVRGSCCVSVSLSILWLWAPTTQSSHLQLTHQATCTELIPQQFPFSHRSPSSLVGKSNPKLRHSWAISSVGFQPQNYDCYSSCFQCYTCSKWTCSSKINYSKKWNVQQPADSVLRQSQQSCKARACKPLQDFHSTSRLNLEAGQREKRAGIVVTPNSYELEQDWHQSLIQLLRLLYHSLK